MEEGYQKFFHLFLSFSSCIQYIAYLYICCNILKGNIYIYIYNKLYNVTSRDIKNEKGKLLRSIYNIPKVKEREKCNKR